jgi:hypothetical protein
MALATHAHNMQIPGAPRATVAPAPESQHPGSTTQQMALALGLLMLLAPPIAVTFVWATPTFSRTAQLALTAYGALGTLVLAAVAIAAIP